MEGFFSAVVADTADPTGQGRARLQIPQVSGETVTGWALPMQTGWSSTGDLVFATFRGGDPHYPLFLPRSRESPWLPLTLSANYGYLDPGYAPAPQVRVTADGFLEFSGGASPVSLPPPNSTDFLFATLPGGIPTPIADQQQLCATEYPNALTSRTLVAAVSNVGAATATTASTAYVSTLTGATDSGPSVSFLAPGSGEVVVSVGAQTSNSVSSAAACVSARITVSTAGGATFLVESDNRAAIVQGVEAVAGSSCFSVTDLVPGSVYVAMLMYRSSSGSSTATFNHRFLRVDPVQPYSTPLVRVSVNTDRTVRVLYPWGGNTTEVNLTGVRARYV
jgi:hypothetical protein